MSIDDEILMEVEDEEMTCPECGALLDITPSFDMKKLIFYCLTYNSQWERNRS